MNDLINVFTNLIGYASDFIPTTFFVVAIPFCSVLLIFRLFNRM